MQDEAGASIMPENKEMLKEQQEEPRITCVCQSPRSHLKELLMTQTEQQNKIVLIEQKVTHHCKAIMLQ